MSLISDLLLTRTVEFLAIGDYYCGLLIASSNYAKEPITPAVSFIGVFVIILNNTVVF